MADEIKRDTVDYRDPTPFDGSKLQPISEISKAIRHKTYGVDTREALAQQGEALVKIMQETGGNQSAEVVAARGKYETIGIREDAQDNEISRKASKEDMIELANKIIPGTPKEVFTTLDELKTKYPNGAQGIYIAGTHWFYYNTGWHDGGVYTGSEATNAEIERISLKQSRYLNGMDVQSIVTDNETGNKGDAKFYVIGRVFSPGFLRKIAFYTFSDSPARVCVFEIKNGEIGVNADQTIEVEQTARKDVTATKGINYVNFDIDVRRNYLIGIQVNGISYTTQSGYASYSVAEWGGVTGSSYSFKFTRDAAAIGLSVYALVDSRLSFNNVYSSNVIKTMPILNQNTETTTPISFNFYEKLLRINGAVGLMPNAKNSKSIDYVDLTTIRELPDMNKASNLPQNYYVLYDIPVGIVFVRYSDGPLTSFNSINPNSQLLIASISIFNGKVEIATPNDSMVNVSLLKSTNDPTTWDATSTVDTIRGGLYNKKYIAVGDSITQGQTFELDYKPDIGNRYPDIVAKKTGMQVINAGVGGTVIHDNGEYSMFQRIKQQPAADVISIMGGTNDFATNIPLGEYGDGNPTEHFKPAFEDIVKYMMTRDEQFIIITPIKRKQPNNSLGLSLEDYVNVELEVAKKYGVPVLDLYNNYQYTTMYSDYYAKYMTDNLHPTRLGYQKIGERVAAFMRQEFGE